MTQHPISVGTGKVKAFPLPGCDGQCYINISLLIKRLVNFFALGYTARAPQFPHSRETGSDLVQIFRRIIMPLFYFQLSKI